ncbi:5-formyltetrahydrofolate cyclo-ligase [Enemella sp. A6]|uniref:5-formyltetrahydrofolate cyclo-ligase n=1 Tax=Enemella sp. A6 TaxID=3440152 RepID=UPI003EBEA03D
MTTPDGPCDSPTPATPTSSADLAALAEAKQTMRRAVRRARSLQDAETRAAADRERTARVLGFLAGRVGPGLTVAAYLSRDDEPGTLELISALHASGVRVLLPVLGPPEAPLREPDWARYAGPEQLRNAAHGITEPATPALGPQALAEAEVIICPALGVTRLGDRLGMGAGWYDRALTRAAAEAVTVALVDDAEVFDILPIEPWDRRVDVVATPSDLFSTLEPDAMR